MITASEAVGMAATGEARIEAFAEDLGRLLGTARAKADSWLEQRQVVAKQLAEIRDTASELLEQLGQRTEGVRRAFQRGRRQVTTDGRSSAAPKQRRRKRRKLSKEGRERIAAAQRARWAKVRRKKG